MKVRADSSMNVKMGAGSGFVAIGLPLRDQSSARGGQGKEKSLLRFELRITPETNKKDITKCAERPIRELPKSPRPPRSGPDEWSARFSAPSAPPRLGRDPYRRAPNEEGRLSNQHH